MALPIPGSRSFLLHSFLSCALLLGLSGTPLALVSCSGESAEESSDDKKPTPKKRKKTSSSSKKSGSSRKSGSSSSTRKKSSGSSSSASSPRSKRKSSSGSSDLAYEVKKLLNSARSSGASRAFSGDYKSAMRYFQQGEDAEDEGEYSLAEKRFERAKSAAEQLISLHKKFQKELEGSKAVLKKLAEAQKEAEEAGVKELAAIDYEDAVAEIERATQTLANATPDSIGDVVGAVESAKGYLEDAVATAKRNRLVSQRAESEKVAMLGYKDRAKTSGADTKAIGDWLQAEQAERNADGLVAQGNFQEAVNAYQLAAQTYIGALTRTVGAAEMKEIMAKTDKERKEREANELALRKEELQTRKEIEERKAEAIEKLREDKARAAGGTYVPPGGSIGGASAAEAEMRNQMAAVKLRSLATELDASIYRQDLDPEDEQFLRENYTELSSALSYDADTGVAYIDYTNSKVMQRDRLNDPRVRSLRRKKYLNFVNPNMEGSENMQSFQANSAGYFYIPVPFKYRVRVRWDMAIGTMDANGSFNCVVMYDPRKKSSYMTEWIHWKYSSRGGRAKTLRMFPEKKYQGSANYWFEKTRSIPMYVEFQMPSEPIESDDPTPEDLEATAKLICSYDAGGGPDQKTNEFISDSPLKEGGWVGFRWSRTKFTVKKLEIEGLLHKKLAVAQLRKITGIKKKGKTSAKKPTTKPTTKPTDGDDDDDDGSTKPQKRITDPKDGFDF